MTRHIKEIDKMPEDLDDERTLPPDPEEMNNTRSEWVRKALIQFAIFANSSDNFPISIPAHDSAVASHQA